MEEHQRWLVFNPPPSDQCVVTNSNPPSADASTCSGSEFLSDAALAAVDIDALVAETAAARVLSGGAAIYSADDSEFLSDEALAAVDIDALVAEAVAPVARPPPKGDEVGLARTFSSESYDKMLANPKLTAAQREKLEIMKRRRMVKDGVTNSSLPRAL